MPRLTTTDHDRGAQRLTWVYAVVSRRARGVSVGINLQPNNACNWRCVYCQIPGLYVGKSPRADLAALERELAQLLEAIRDGTFLEDSVEPEARRLADIAFSGNGEPTASAQFEAAVEIAIAARARAASAPVLRVITNGSLVRVAAVERAFARLAECGGEIWFKLDRATDAGLRTVNNASTNAARQLENLERCAALAPTWIQTCLFAQDGAPPVEDELAALEHAYARAARFAAPPRGVLLYGLARASQQPEAPRLARLDDAWMHACARRFEHSGLAVEAHP